MAQMPPPRRQELLRLLYLAERSLRKFGATRLADRIRRALRRAGYLPPE